MSSSRSMLMHFENNIENQTNIQNILLAEGELVNEYGPRFLNFALHHIQQNVRRLSHEISVKHN